MTALLEMFLTTYRENGYWPFLMIVKYPISDHMHTHKTNQRIQLHQENRIFFL